MKYSDSDKEVIRRFSCLFVKNEKLTTAKRCVANLKVLKKPTEARQLDIMSPLHWADIPYNYKTTEPDPVDIGSERRRLDVAFALISESPQGRSHTPSDTTFHINPAGQPNISGILPYPSYGTHQTPSEQPNISGTLERPMVSGSYSPSSFLQFQIAGLASRGGAFIAAQIALSNPSDAVQYYLPPGDYEVEISVNCENGKGDKKTFKLTSSVNPDGLDIEEMV